MQITGKGKVTIPMNVRDQLGLLPYTEVEFELADDHARIRKLHRKSASGQRGDLAIQSLRGTADFLVSTDEILALTRDDDFPAGCGE